MTLSKRKSMSIRVNRLRLGTYRTVAGGTGTLDVVQVLADKQPSVEADTGILEHPVMAGACITSIVDLQPFPGSWSRKADRHSDCQKGPQSQPPRRISRNTRFRCRPTTLDASFVDGWRQAWGLRRISPMACSTVQYAATRTASPYALFPSVVHFYNLVPSGRPRRRNKKSGVLLACPMMCSEKRLALRHTALSLSHLPGP